MQLKYKVVIDNRSSLRRVRVREEEDISIELIIL